VTVAIAPSVTQVRVLASRLPEPVRQRLRKLARRGGEVCSRHGAPLLAEVCAGLSVALVDLASAELRATSAEARARRAEHDAKAAKAVIRSLERDLADALRSVRATAIDPASATEFAEPAPTAVGHVPLLIARCRTGGQ
jgi:hypothetical protein